MLARRLCLFAAAWTGAWLALYVGLHFGSVLLTVIVVAAVTVGGLLVAGLQRQVKVQYVGLGVGLCGLGLLSLDRLVSFGIFLLPALLVALLALGLAQMGKVRLDE